MSLDIISSFTDIKTGNVIFMTRMLSCRAAEFYKDLSMFLTNYVMFRKYQESLIHPVGVFV